ncbi:MULTISPECIES: DUF305 domain-containing protein [Streptomyces]|uniref:Lipoprotein n=1 Tax=Streptomyces zinciresistens K42 TaxID=700597 RepID=G2G5V3_9ACTN|nr:MULTISPECIES: DUF305 domain-containing protein [Streptomyces]EGX61042.1 lipoprotein [Streptomyces zinciresistens K42]MDT9696567.1 DUF305 domain-containing protein [Streptomyces sp. P17]
MTAHRKLVRRTAIAVTAGAAALVLSACGGGGHDMSSMGSDSSPSATASAKAGDHNDQDVSFAEEMIQHHRQAVDMAELAADRASSQEVKDLATKIKGAQDPEIETMSGWLTSWGEEVPQDMSGMDMSSSTPGMMGMEDMDMLEKASGAEFDKMFLEMMVKHHEGAIKMAKTQKADGKYGPAVKLADDVITAQTAEIEQMKKMLGES